VAIGVAQALAVVPGVSRSGSTVVVALWLGVEAEEAAAFSFLMAIPAIAGAAVLQVLGTADPGAGIAVEALVLGSAVAAVTGVVAIRAFVSLLARRTFHRFALYCWSLGLGFLAYLFVIG
jgi:undecaprenyl-diphosphatase